MPGKTHWKALDNIIRFQKGLRLGCMNHFLLLDPASAMALKTAKLSRYYQIQRLNVIQNKYVPRGKYLFVKDGIKMIRRTFLAKNFKAALSAIADYGAAVEMPGANHHPDLHITSYRSVTIEFYTFSSKGLTIDDFVMAAKLDAVPILYSPKFLRENPVGESRNSGKMIDNYTF